MRLAGSDPSFPTYSEQVSSLDQVNLDLLFIDDVSLLIHLNQVCLGSLQRYQLGQGFRGLSLEAVKHHLYYFFVNKRSLVVDLQSLQTCFGVNYMQQFCYISSSPECNDIIPYISVVA